MGNGAGVEATIGGKKTFMPFDQLEKLCRSGHFQHEHNEYMQVLRSAMLTDSLDYLEILLVSGNTKKAQPLHLACSLGKLEAVELLLSAGYSGDLQNKEGRTALHMCCITANAEAGLCASLLCIEFPKSMKKFDYMGFTPFHFASIQNNPFVLKAMVQHNVELNKPSQMGKTALELAKEHKCDAALQFLQTEINRGKSGVSTDVNHDVGQDRIMEVWERFFENAFKRAGVDMEYEEEFDPIASFGDTKHKTKKNHNNANDYYAISDKSKSAKSPSKSQKKKYDDDDKYEDSYWLDQSVYSPQVEKATFKNSYDNHDYTNDDYLHWILLFEESSYNDEQYFVTNKWTKESKWLNDHMNTMYTEGYNFRFLYSSSEEIEELPYPTCLDELKQYGWITYYSKHDNYCMWMNMITGKIEYFLPLGMYESGEVLQQWEFQPCEDDEEWYEADQTCARSWIMVLTNDVDENHQTIYYFFNTFTSATSWDEPVGWAELVAHWSNWTLCCMEDNFDSKFWYCNGTGESIWV